MKHSRVSPWFVVPAVALLTVSGAVPSAHALDIGPGTGVSSSGADSGERLNIDDTSFLTLQPGRYEISDFSFFSTSAAGTAIPFLATLNGTNSYDLLWIGSGVASSLNSLVTADPAGGFTLSVATQVYAGFYTAGTGRVAFVASGGTTDHAGVVTVPRGGVSISTFSNPDLTRRYAFKIGVTPSSLLTVGPGFLSNGNVDTGDRLNIDQAHPLTFAPGQYNVEDFSFLGTSAAGSVTPFLVRLASDNTYEVVWVGGAVSGSLGGVSTNPDGGFSLATEELLYAGFYTAGGAFVAYTEGVARPPGFGLTDHDNTFTAPAFAGEIIGGFSNPDLARQYSFSIGVAAVPEPASAGLVLLSGALLLARRRRMVRADA